MTVVSSTSHYFSAAVNTHTGCCCRPVRLLHGLHTAVPADTGPQTAVANAWPARCCCCCSHRTPEEFAAGRPVGSVNIPIMFKTAEGATAGLLQSHWRHSPGHPSASAGSCHSCESMHCISSRACRLAHVDHHTYIARTALTVSSLSNADTA